MASKMDRSKVVVVLEDDDQMRELLAENLQNKGYYVVPVETGLRALEVLQQVRARLLVLDVMLADMPGSRVLELMQADERTKDVPVMVLSGHLHRPDAIRDAEGRHFGRDRALKGKPFAIDQVSVEVEKLIGKPFVDDFPHNLISLLGPHLTFGKGMA